MIATLTAKGQITLPKNIRLHFKLTAGDKIDFVLLDNGTIQAVPLKQSPQKLKGIIKKPAKSVSIEEMNDAIIYGASKK